MPTGRRHLPVSRDASKTFSVAPRRHARSPAFDPYRNAGLFSDDIQDLR
jgi:hypothetical protein